MSLLNVFVSPSRVLVSVDTNAISPHGNGNYEISKLIPLAHANTVLAARGVNTFLLEVFAGCFLLPRADCDRINAWLPGAIDEIWKRVAALAAQGGLAENILGGCDLLVAGWSPSLSAMSAVRYAREPNAHAFTIDPIHACMIAPKIDWKCHEPDRAPDGLTLMQGIARNQVDHILAAEPGQPIGGRLLVAEITRDGIAIRNMGKLG